MLNADHLGAAADVDRASAEAPAVRLELKRLKRGTSAALCKVRAAHAVLLPKKLIANLGQIVKVEALGAQRALGRSRRTARRMG